MSIIGANCHILERGFCILLCTEDNMDGFKLWITFCPSKCCNIPNLIAAATTVIVKPYNNIKPALYLVILNELQATANDTG